MSSLTYKLPSESSKPLRGRSRRGKEKGGREKAAGAGCEVKCSPRYCLPEIQGQRGACSDPPPFPLNPTGISRLSRSEKETSAQHSWAPRPRLPRTMGRVSGRGLQQGGRQGPRLAGERQGFRALAGRPAGREMPAPGPQLLTHGMCQGQVTSLGAPLSRRDRAILRPLSRALRT